MILRRIAHHLQQQQWTAVLIELVILILGVFLGFQVTDWANERANRSAETRHLEEIAEDLRADAEALDVISTSAQMRISGIDYILGETRGVTRPSRVVTPTGNSFDMPAGPPVAQRIARRCSAASAQFAPPRAINGLRGAARRGGAEDP
jgi:hypothetical protein